MAIGPVRTSMRASSWAPNTAEHSPLVVVSVIFTSPLASIHTALAGVERSRSVGDQGKEGNEEQRESAIWHDRGPLVSGLVRIGRIQWIGNW